MLHKTLRSLLPDRLHQLSALHSERYQVTTLLAMFS